MYPITTFINYKSIPILKKSLTFIDIRLLITFLVKVYRVVPAYCCLTDESGFDDALIWYDDIISFLDLTHTLMS